LSVLASGVRDRTSVSHESFQRNGDLWKILQDLAIDSQQPNSVRMRQRDEFTVISRTFRRDYFLVQAAMMLLCAFL